MAHGSLISGKAITVQIMRRDLLPPAPGSAEPRHDYVPILTTRASVKSRGQSEFSRIEVNGMAVTHTFSIRYTSIPFDTRHRLRDVRGNLYKILKIDNVDLGNTEYRIDCALQGSDDLEAAR
jgi:hypothetical protein